MENLKSSLFIIGNLLVFFSIYSFIPGLVDYYYGGTDWVVFFVISIVCLFTGLNVSFIFKRKDKDVEVLSAFLLTLISWIILASIGFLISVFGCLGFLVSGILIKNDKPLSAGFINIPAFFVFIPITIVMAKVGATTVHKMKKGIIAKLFGFFLLIIASRFLYDYFNL